MKKVLVVLVIILSIGVAVLTYNCFKLKDENTNLKNKNQASQISSSQSKEEKNNTTQSENKTNQKINNSTNTNLNTSTDISDNLSENIVTKLSPSGFAGSSMIEVVLYPNKEVYVINYDGGGFEESNIKNRELIAKNVDLIYKDTDEEHFGEIIIKGGEKVGQNYGWINYEK